MKHSLYIVISAALLANCSSTRRILEKHGDELRKLQGGNGAELVEKVVEYCSARQNPAECLQEVSTAVQDMGLGRGVTDALRQALEAIR